MADNKPLIAHLSMFTACAIWGLMSPLGKDAMTHGLDGITMVSFRVMGGAILFWLTSFLMKQGRMTKVWRAKRTCSPDTVASTKVPLRDKFHFALAAIFGLVCNQCCFTIGLSITSPVNASIVTTSMPIFAMILSFLILREPITWKKAGGVIIGCAGAVTLILTSVHASDARVGDIRGDLLVLGAQLSYALFLSIDSSRNTTSSQSTVGCFSGLLSLFGHLACGMWQQQSGRPYHCAHGLRQPT